MKAPHLARVTAPAADFAPLAAACTALGLRLGWLDWPAAPAGTWPPELAAPLTAGCVRAVHVGPRGTLAAKPRRGPAVLRDVLREHFLGCALVLVAGEPPGAVLPHLVASPAGFRLDGLPTWWTAAELAARFRGPRPWGETPAETAP